MEYRGHKIEDECWVTEFERTAIGKETGFIGAHYGALEIGYREIVQLKTMLDIMQKILVSNPAITGDYTGRFKNVRYKIEAGTDEDGDVAFWLNICWDRPENGRERMQRIRNEEQKIDKKIELEKRQSEIDKLFDHSFILSSISTEELEAELEKRKNTQN